MIIPKIDSHTASVEAKNKNNRVPVLGRGTRLKSKRYSPPASLSGRSTNVPAKRLERPFRTAQE